MRLILFILGFFNFLVVSIGIGYWAAAPYVFG